MKKFTSTLLIGTLACVIAQPSFAACKTREIAGDWKLQSEDINGSHYCTLGINTRGALIPAKSSCTHYESGGISTETDLSGTIKINSACNLQVDGVSFVATTIFFEGQVSQGRDVMMGVAGEDAASTSTFVALKVN